MTTELILEAAACPRCLAVGGVEGGLASSATHCVVEKDRVVAIVDRADTKASCLALRQTERNAWLCIVGIWTASVWSNAVRNRKAAANFLNGGCRMTKHTLDPTRDVIYKVLQTAIYYGSVNWLRKEKTENSYFVS